MTARSSIIFLVGLLGACGSPEEAPSSAVLLSEHGLVEAQVRFDGPIERGTNSLTVELRPTGAGEQARLTSVDAIMPAHTHRAHAAAIEPTEQGFRAAELDLYMTGRWQLLLKVELEPGGELDSAAMPIDVP